MTSHICGSNTIAIL